MTSALEDINEILADWNPVEVPIDIAKDEYKSYVPRIISIGPNYDKIKTELITILTVDLGLTFDEKNVFQQDEVEKVAIQIVTRLA